MKKYNVALSFYVEESADSLEAAKSAAIRKLKYKGIVHELDATGVKDTAVADNSWREITITNNGGQG